jgi:predicted ester cyclase
MSPDKQGVKAYFAAFRRAVPDLHAQVHDMLADGDKVVTRKTFHVIDIVRVRDGKFVEHWNVLDTLALMRQMGTPSPG